MTPPQLIHAVSQLAEGVREERGNRGIPFTRYALPGEDPLPWCARFVRWCFIQAGTPLPGNRYLIGRVSTMMEVLGHRGAMVSIAEPGDIIFLRDRGESDKQPGGHHVGIVERVDGDAIVSIDGNWGDKVSRVTRTHGAPEIAGFARWPTG